MMRCALCLLLVSGVCGLDDDGCLAQASVRVHVDSQQAQPPNLLADTVRGLWKSYVKKQLADMGETVAVDQDHATSQEEGGSTDAEAPEAKETAEQIQATAKEEEDEEEEERSPAQAEEDGQRSVAQEEAARHQHASELKSAKYGEQMTLLVKDALGREFRVQFHRSTPLRVLMGSVCKRLGLEQSQVLFKHNGVQINGDDTPEAVGVADQDTIEVDGQVLQKAKAAKDRAEQKAAVAEKKKAEREAKGATIAATKEQKRMRVVKQAAKVQTQQKREHMLRTRDEGTLRFANEEGKEIQMSYKKLNWLRGLMSLVCKRFGMDPDGARFYHGEMLIGPHDSIQSLGLRDDELITVKSA